MLLLAAAKLRRFFLICKILGVFFLSPTLYFTKTGKAPARKPCFCKIISIFAGGNNI